MCVGYNMSPPPGAKHLIVTKTIGKHKTSYLIFWL